MDLNRDLYMTCNCYKKNFLVKKQYLLYLNPLSIIITKTSLDNNPKYVFELSFHLKIEWNLKKQKLKSFTVHQNKNIYTFFSDTQSLQKIKSFLANKVCFLKINTFYKPQNFLGDGSTSKVYQVQDLQSQQLYACKCIERKKNDAETINSLSELIQMEIRTMVALNHENIMKIHEIFQGEGSYYLILDLMDGPNLNSIINQNYQGLNITDVQTILKKILAAAAEMHYKGILHRDLKPENILMKNKKNYEYLKISDFGLSNFCSPYPFILYKCGTPGYVAPEIANLNSDFTPSQLPYDTKCDVFSIGCIFYKMVTGQNLFPGETQSQTLQLNKSCDINIRLNISQARKFTEQALDLLDKMIIKDPQLRISAQEALLHPFLCEQKQYPLSQNMFQKNFSFAATPLTNQIITQSSKVREESIENLKEIDESTNCQIQNVPLLMQTGNSFGEENHFITKLNSCKKIIKIESKVQISIQETAYLTYDNSQRKISQCDYKMASERKMRFSIIDRDSLSINKNMKQ